MSASTGVGGRSIEQLTTFGAALLEAAGASPSSALRVSQGLVGSDAHGVASHGLRVLPRYVEAIERGELDPVAEPKVEHDGGSYALVSGSWTFGHVGADLATRVAIAKARESGVALVGLVESHHMGRLGEYVEIAAREGVSMGLFNGGQGAEAPIAAPFGGRTAVMHTNPIAMGSPGQPEHPLVVDVATTSVAGSKVDMAREKGQVLEPGLLLDADGEPTTDPMAYFSGGALLPFGGHKGYGFMLTAELLGRTLLGADDRGGGVLGGPVLGRSGTAFVAWRCDLFIPRERYEERVSALFARIHAVPPQAGFDRVLVPGDLEAEALARSEADGVRLEPMTWTALTGLAGRLSVEVPGPAPDLVMPH